MGTRLFLFIGLLSLSVSASATPEIQYWTLANGARVYFVEAHELPMVQLRVVFDAGSSRDPKTKRGLGVMTAIQLGQGTDKLDADQIAGRFESLGAEFGRGGDRETAFVSLRSLSDPKQLQPALELLAQILIVPQFPGESLDRERQRTLVGLQHQQQLPGQIAEKLFYKTIYAGHPYADYPSGDKEGLQAITRDDLVNHHKRYYVGANAVLAIVGDLSKREARAAAKTLLSGLPRGKASLSISPVSLPNKSQEQRVAFPSTQTHIQIGLPGLKRMDPDYFPLYVGNHILGGSGLVSRLAKIIREEHGLSYSVYSYFYPMKELGPFRMGLQTKNSQREQAMSLLSKTLADYIEQGPTQEELIAAKKNITGGFPLRIDSNSKIAAYLAAIGFYNLPLTYLDDFIQRVEAVTVEQIRDAFKRHVPTDKLVTVVVGGEN